MSGTFIPAATQDHHEAHTPIVTAPMPTPVFPGSLASPSALSYVMTQKYVYAQPLYQSHFWICPAFLAVPPVDVIQSVYLNCFSIFRPPYMIRIIATVSLSSTGK